MFKPMGFFASVIFSVALVVAGAAFAASLDGRGGESIAAVADPQEDNSLSITIQGKRSDQGRVLVMVFDDASAFTAYDHNRAIGYQELSAQSDKLTFNFSALNQGPYAVFAMHDENSDYQLNEQDGYPVEGFVVSGAKSKYDEPGFKQAAVAEGKLELQLMYF